MPSTEDLIREKLERLEWVPEDLEEEIEKFLPQIERIVEREVKRMAMSDGNFVRSRENLARISALEVEIIDLIFAEGSSYRKAILEYRDQFDRQANINLEYFNAAFTQEVEAQGFALIVENAKRRALAQVDQNAVGNHLLQPINNVLSQAITGESSFSDTLANLNRIVLGNEEVEPTMLGRNRTAYRDAFSIFDREYTAEIATDLGVEFYSYSGGRVRDTRSFCTARTGKIFHIEEIMSWGNIKQWQGRNANTNEDNIRFLLGGYNCIHSLIPRSNSYVQSNAPAAYARAQSKGYLQAA